MFLTCHCRFTGKLVTRHIATNVPSLVWAIAGRSKEKLDDVISSLPEGSNKPAIEIIDVIEDDEEKVKALLRDTKLVIDVVGPYSYYGEKVLKPCVEVGTAWVDLNGEIPW